MDGGTGMNGKRFGVSGLATWFVALTVLFGGLMRPVRAEAQDIREQEKTTEQDKQQKKEDKKDEKKDEKKGLPLKPTRKIEFTTDEGTWLSLDVSPDGKTIVFELLGD